MELCCLSMLIINILQSESYFVQWISSTLCNVKAEFKINSTVSKLFCIMHAEEVSEAHFPSSVVLTVLMK